jgi:hypothetical protein
VTAPRSLRRAERARSGPIGKARRSGTPSASLPTVLGELEAVVVEVKPWDVHGVGYVDVTVVYPDRVLETARLGPESIPDHLQPGEHVIVNKAVNMILGIRRP